MRRLFSLLTFVGRRLRLRKTRAAAGELDRREDRRSCEARDLEDWSLFSIDYELPLWTPDARQVRDASDRLRGKVETSGRHERTGR